MNTFKIGDKVRAKEDRPWEADITKTDICTVTGLVGNDAFYYKSETEPYGRTWRGHFGGFDLVKVAVAPTPIAPEVATVLSTGIKHDQNKPDMSLLSSTALIKITQVMDYGKKKYAAHNWRKGMAWSRLLAGVLRHIFAYLGGESKDPETGLSHIAHASCGLMFLLEYEETHADLDDRYKP